VQLVSDTGKYRLLMAQNSPVELVQSAILKPLNTKLGKECFALASSSETAINVTFSSACAEAAVRTRLETAPPAGLLDAPPTRGKPLLKGRMV
jgi:serine/threonine-protein kinase